MREQRLRTPALRIRERIVVELDLYFAKSLSKRKEKYPKIAAKSSLFCSISEIEYVVKQPWFLFNQ